MNGTEQQAYITEHQAYEGQRLSHRSDTNDVTCKGSFIGSTALQPQEQM